MSGSRSAPGGFFADADFDYEARIVLGATASGLGDVGLVLTTLDRITGAIILYMLKFSKNYPDRVTHEPAEAPASH